jgi:Tol biopolymer transport system component
MFVAALVGVPLAALTLGGLSGSAASAKVDANRYWILLSSNRDGNTRAYSVRADGSRLTPLLPSSRGLKPLAVSRDGSMIAYIDSRSSIYASRADGTGLRRLARSGSLGVAAFSHYGKRLAFADGNGIRVVDLDGRVLLRVKSDGLGSAYNWGWSPDGRALVFSTEIDADNERYALVVQPLKGKRRAVVRTGPSLNSSDGGVAEPKWSPDGHWIAYVNDEDNGRRHGLWVVRPNGERLHRVAPDLPSPEWSPDGRWIAYRAYEGDKRRDGLWIVRSSGERRHRLAPAAEPVVFSWSPDGKRLAYSAGSDGAVVGLDGRELGRLRPGFAPSGLAWSPDGRRVALVGGRDVDPGPQIWIVDRDGRNLQRLTSEGRNSLLGWTRLAPGLPPVAPVPPTERVLGPRSAAIRARVARLAADGPRVALVPKTTATDCEHVAVWAPAETSIRRFGPPPGPCSGPSASISELALASSRTAWIANEPYSFNPDTCAYTLASATLDDPRPLEVADNAGSPCKAQDYYHLRGHGDLLVFNDGSRLVRIGIGHEKCSEGRFSRYKTSSLCTILDAQAAPVDSVSRGLIAIRKAGAVTVLDDEGKLVRAFTFAPANVSAAFLDGGSLVVWRFGVLEVHDVATGARELSRPLPTGFRPADVDGGIAVLRKADIVMLLRLEDDRSLTLRPGGGSVLADLEPAGLYYSYASSDGGRRVDFLPCAELLRKLGGASC